jgi:hypothetical protein
MWCPGDMGVRAKVTRRRAAPDHEKAVVIRVSGAREGSLRDAHAPWGEATFSWTRCQRAVIPDPAPTLHTR